MSTTTGYTLSTTTTATVGEAVERVRSELQEEGFGVLREIDVRAPVAARVRERLAEVVRRAA